MVNRAQAATFTIHEENEMDCTITMEGVIKEGDADEFRRLLAEQILTQLLDTGNSFAPQTLCLDSPRGSFLEAISIADTLAFCYLCDEIDALGKGLLADRYPVSASVRWTPTAIGSQQVCESACALIFMAGGILAPPGNPDRRPSRFLHINGQLGFHSPAARLSQGTYSQDEVEAAFNGAVQIISMLRERLAGYHFPVSLFGHMIATPESEMFQVTSVGQLVDWEIASVGVPRIKDLNSLNIQRVCRTLSHARTSGSWRQTYENSAPRSIRSDSRPSYYRNPPRFVNWPPKFDVLEQVFLRDDPYDWIPHLREHCGNEYSCNISLLEGLSFGLGNLQHLFFPPYVTLSQISALSIRSDGSLDPAIWLEPVIDVFDATCLVYRDAALVSETDCSVIYETSERLDGLVVRSTARVSVSWPVVTRDIGRLSSCPNDDIYAKFEVDRGQLYFPSGQLTVYDPVARDHVFRERLPSNELSDVCSKRFEKRQYEKAYVRAFEFCVASSERDVFCLVWPDSIPTRSTPVLEARGI